MEAGIIEKRIRKPMCTIHITIDHFNKRIRVDDYLGHFQECVEETLKVAKSISAEKIIFKSRKENVMALLAQGFLYEGSIDKFFLGSDCFFLVKYNRNERRNSANGKGKIKSLPMFRCCRLNPDWMNRRQPIKAVKLKWQMHFSWPNCMGKY